MKLPDVQNIFPELHTEFRVDGRPVPFIRVNYHTQRQWVEETIGHWPFRRKEGRWQDTIEVETWSLLNYNPKHREIVPQEELIAELVCIAPFDLQITAEAPGGQQASRLLRGMDYVGEIGGVQPFRSAAVEVGWLWHAEEATPWETWPSPERKVEQELMGRGAQQVAEEQQQMEQAAQNGPNPRDILHTPN